MYHSISENLTKTKFIELLDETIHLIEKETSITSSDYYESILMQLRDLKEQISKNGLNMYWDDIYERYSFPTLGEIYLQNNPDLNLRLKDISYGAVHYNSFSE